MFGDIGRIPRLQSRPQKVRKLMNGSADAGLDGAERLTQTGCDFRMSQSIKVGQLERISFVGVECGQRGID